MSSNQKKKIGIDCRLAGLSHAGIGRYIENLIHSLLKQGKNISWVFFFSDQKQASEVLGKSLYSENVSVVYAPFRHYTFSEQIRLPQIFLREELDLLHVPHFNTPVFYPGKTIVTIHDLLWHEQRGKSVTTLNSWMYWPKYLGYKIVTLLSVIKAKKILVPSKTIRQTLIKHYPQAKNKILVTYEGITKKFFINSERKKNLTQLVYTGSLYPHKNLRFVIQALLLAKKYSLAIVSSRSVFQEEIENEVKKWHISDRISFLGRLSDTELVKLYQNSLALIQPSLSEGFGLTGLEAMASGIPVLASDIPVFKEIYSDSAMYFNPRSTTSFLESLKSLSEKKQTELIQKGHQRSSTFQWDETARLTLEAYYNALT